MQHPGAPGPFVVRRHRAGAAGCSLSSPFLWMVPAGRRVPRLITDNLNCHHSTTPQNRGQFHYRQRGLAARARESFVLAVAYLLAPPGRTISSGHRTAMSSRQIGRARVCLGGDNTVQPVVVVTGPYVCVHEKRLARGDGTPALRHCSGRPTILPGSSGSLANSIPSNRGSLTPLLDVPGAWSRVEPISPSSIRHTRISPVQRGSSSGICCLMRARTGRLSWMC